MSRALLQNALSTNPNIEGAMEMPSSEFMFRKRAVHKCIHMYAFIHM